MIYTPKHASWLNIRAGPVEAQAEHAVLLKPAELEFSALSKQCLDRRIAERDRLASELNAWQTRRNQAQVKLDWQCSKEHARQTFKRAYTDVKLSELR